MPDALPLVGPGVDHVLANLDACADGAASPFGPPITDDQSIAIHALGF